MTQERLFFAATVAAAWPSHLPEGRLTPEESRHITLAFLRSAETDLLLKKIDQAPRPLWNTAPSGVLQGWTFLPESDPHCVAALPLFLEQEKAFLDYEQKLSSWLFDQKFLTAINSSFLPHVSVARFPADLSAWRSFRCKIPFYISAITLYKSLGHSRYETVWNYPLLPPFEEVEHTADIAYKIRGHESGELAFHATLALAFAFPSFTRYLNDIPPCHSIRDIVSLMNRWIAEIDTTEGIGLKAVSYHADRDNNEWTMIIDV